MLIGWMVRVDSIKFPFRIFLGAPIPILAISGDIMFWFVDSPLFNIFKSLNITLVGYPSFSVGTGMGSVTSSSLDCFKDKSFVFLQLGQTSC